MNLDFLRKIHPKLVEKIPFILQDLRDRGWDPVIPEVSGPQGTGYRSIADQLKLRREHPGRTGVNFSFHNVTNPSTGTPEAMAVHITEKNLARTFRGNIPKGHPFLQDLQTAAERHGATTGNAWKKPWDPLHVQLYPKGNPSLSAIKAGVRPPVPESRLRLWVPQPGLQPPPSYLPPRSLENLKAGEKFQLQMPRLGTSLRPSQPQLANQFLARRPSFNLQQPHLGASLAGAHMHRPAHH